MRAIVRCPVRHPPSAVSDRVALGVDVGGTTIAVGAVTETGEILAEEQAATHGSGPGTAITTVLDLVDRLKDRVESSRAPIAGIGLGVPGIVDPATGAIADEALNVPELGGVPLARVVGERFGVPAFIDNDVNALALAEWTFGAGRGAASLVVLALGTGFGAGLVIDGRVVRGARGFGGELGHTPVKFDGRPCWCGGRGCVAVYASGRGIAEAARERVTAGQRSSLLDVAGGDPLRITAPMVFLAAGSGDRVASDIVDEACRALGAMIATVVNGLNPEVVVITGGVAASFATLEREVLGAAAEHTFRRALAGTRILIVPGDKRVTMRGAAALAFHELDQDPGRARSPA